MNSRTKQLHLIQRINPLNKESEKRKFLFDTNYNPQFTYINEISSAELETYGKVSTTHLETAKRIIDTVIKTWKTESEFLTAAEGKVMTREEVSSQITQYLKEHDLEQIVAVRFTQKLISRTAVDGYQMNVRLPIEYRELSFKGVLDHEIGTHILRRVNDRQQPWFGEREKYGMLPYVETEEGLATLHNHISMKEKQMWLKALLYYAAHLASTMSFVQLFEALKPYVDSRERRWNVCLRVKRGISDTSIPGVFPKDQVYLRGFFRVLRWLQKHDYDIRPLYYGKIDIDDEEKARLINPQYVVKLPKFFADNIEQYKNAVMEIQKVNAL